MMLGEHGDSQFLPYSQVRVNDIPLKRYLEEHDLPLDEAEMEKSVVYRGHRAFFGKVPPNTASPTRSTPF